MRHALFSREDRMAESRSGRTFPYPYGSVAWGLVFLAALPRLVQYLHYRPLWSDEAVLVAHMVTKSARELLGPLEDCMAPPGYLIATKVLIMLFGVSEYVARLPSFVGGLVTPILFLSLSRRFTTPLCAVIGLAFVAASKHLIYYGAEVRPYSTDAAIALLLVWLALQVQSDQPSFLRVAVFGLAGAAAVWFSFPSAFFLAGIGVAQALPSLCSGRCGRVGRLAYAYCAWAASFLALHAVSISQIEQGDRVMTLMNEYYSYAGAFMPFPPHSLKELAWFPTRFRMFCDMPGGLPFTGLAAFASAVGCASLLGRGKQRLGLLLFPLLFALIASGMRKYPFHARMTLYLAPVFFLFVGEGVGYVMEKLQGRAAWVGVLLLVLLIGQPACRAARVIIEPTSHHEFHRTLDYARDRWQDGDTLYMAHSQGLAFLFCKHRYDFPEDRCIVEPKITAGVDRTMVLQEQLPKLWGRARVWMPVTYDLPERTARFAEMVDAFGKRLDEFHARGASVYLYAFTGERSAGEERYTP